MSLSEYEEFYDELMSNFNDMRQVALDKLTIEELVTTGAIEVPSWVPGSVPGRLGDVEAVDFEACEEALSDLASTYLSADSEEMESMSQLLKSAMRELNGPADGSADTGQGVDPIIGDIHGGLSSWDSEAGELFTMNFVDTIGNRKTNLHTAIDYAERAVRTAKILLYRARTAAAKLPFDTKRALNDYDPWSWLLWSGAKLGLIGLGLGANTTGNLLIAVTDNQLVTPDADLTVAEVISTLTEAVGEFIKDVRALEDELAARIGAESARVERDWGGHVCSRPVQVQSHTSGDDLVV